MRQRVDAKTTLPSTDSSAPLPPLPIPAAATLRLNRSVWPDQSTITSLVKLKGNDTGRGGNGRKTALKASGLVSCTRHPASMGGHLSGRALVVGSALSFQHGKAKEPLLQKVSVGGTSHEDEDVASGCFCRGKCQQHGDKCQTCISGATHSLSP